MNSPQHYTEINSRRRSYSSSTTSHNNANNNNNNNNRDFNNNISSSHRRSRVRGRRSFSTEQQLSTDRRLSPLQVVVSTAATTSPPVRHPNESSDPQQQQQYGTRITPSVAATTTATTTYPPAIYTHRSRPPPVNVKHQQGLVSPYLVQLSDSCRAHRTVAHSSSSSFHNTDTDNDDNNNTMTDACRHDLMALQRLLPTVEASVRSSVEPTTNTSIKPLCDFYIQSLSSGNHGNNNHWFCPHAPEQLWSHTRHILPRMALLVQHLASLAAAVAPDEDPVLNMDTPIHGHSDGAVVDSISNALARFFPALPDSKLALVVWSDWIAFAHDLAIVREADVWNDIHAVDGACSDTAILAAVEVPLFEETVAALNGRDDDNVDVSWSLSFSLLDGCYNIRITNADALQTLQMVVLNVLSHAVVVRKTRWLQDNNNEYYPSPTTTTLPIVLDAVEVLEDRDETYYTASSTMDLYYAGVPFRSVQILMIVLRQALLGKEVTSLMSQSPMTKASDPIVVQQRLQLTATDILVQLQADWHRTAAPNMGILLEVSLLVVRYCVMFVKHRSALVTSCSSLASDIAANLSILVSTLVLVPPLVGGSATRSSIVSVVHGATMEDLCESLLFLSQWSDSTNDLPVSGRTNNISQSQTQLPVVLLRTINTMLHTAKLKDAFSADSDLSFALPLVLTREGVSVLFQLLHDRTLSDNAMFILSHLLCRAFQFGDCDHFDIDGVTEKFIDEALHHTKDGSLRVEHCEVEASATSGAKRMTSPFVTSGEERATVLIKRQRLCGDWARNTTISFFTDELLCYFGHALHSASSLQASAQSPRLSDGKSWIDSQLSDALLTEFLNVSGALRLVLTAARLVNTRRSFSPALLRMVEIFLNSMSTVNEAVLKTILPEGEEKSLLLRTIAESSVVCGLCIELSAGSAFSDLSSAISCSQNAAILAKKWIMIPCWLTSTKTHSRAFDETIYGFSLLKDADERLAQRNELSKLLRVFEGHVASASIDVIKSGLLCVRFSSMFESLGGDTILHRQRLRTIASYLGKQWNETSSSTELEIFTLEVCMLADKGRADTIVRFLLWQSVAWMFFSVDPKRLREQIASVFTSCSESDRWTSTFLVHTLVDTACSDPDPMVRDYCSRHLGKVLSANNWNSFIASYSTHEEWDQVRSTEIVDDAEIRLEESFKSVAGRFFRYIDCFLNKSSSATQPLSSSTNADHSVESDEGFSRSALRSLSSFFFAKDATIYENCGDVIINLALVRIVRLWSAALAIQAIDMSCVYFFEMTSLSYRHPFRNTHSSGGAHFVFREMLGSSLEIDGESGDIESRNCGQIERKFDFLSTLVRFVCLDGMPLNDVSDLSSHSDLVEMCLPRAITQLVIDKQYDALQLIAGYDHYFRSVILSEQKHLRKSIKISIGTRFSPGLISTNARTLTTLPLSKQWSRDLQKTTSNLCIGTRMSEQILPPILIHGSQDVTVFFFEKVLKGKLTMKQMLDNKGMIILKNFITELGQSPENLVSIVVAMKKAASVRKNVGNEEDNSALVAWTTEYFMYLLVNIVQQKWSTKSIKQRVNSLRSLLYSFDYLSPSEASQYFPQILAIVNTSSSEDGHSRYMAARILVKFVTLVARSQWEVVGQHLTSIVVSLIPIFEDDGAIKESKKFDPICRQCAIDFLEWLTQGDLGVKLTPYFSNIPFLPQSNALSTFHATLVSLGVKFDDLDVSCVSATPDCDHLCRISDTVSSGGDSRGASTNSGRQLALRRRLETVCPLLRSERVGIRRVVLIHITSVLRANRDVFQTLLENDSATSVKRFVTLSYPGQTGFPGWTVTDMVDVLLTLCVNETDVENRVLLATCFGEVGAIAAHRLEDVKDFSKTGQRFADPPWHSTPHQYLLHILSHHLVTALQAAHSLDDQNKIAFSIQQVLALLNASAKEGYLDARSEIEPIRETTNLSRRSKLRTSTISDAHMGESSMMEPSLKLKLENDNILDFVEPFWFSSFREPENNIYITKEPPFFRNSTDFYGWISHWSRYMVHRAHDVKVNRWTAFFFACRTALRTQAGTSAAEFLLPILIVDRLCFGNGKDQTSLHSELRDVLTFDGSSTKAIRMPLSDRRRAVNLVFSILDLLQHWVDPEQEAKHNRRSRSHGSNHVGDRAEKTSIVLDWSQCEASMRIEGLQEAIPLSLRAHAAACVGMHASALRYLEMGSRLEVVDKVFGSAALDLDIRSQNRSRAAGKCNNSERSLMKDVLASLNDVETMTAFTDDDVLASPLTRTKDGIRQKVALEDWQGAWQDYESSRQLLRNDPSSDLGILRCLIELGHYDSVLQHVSTTIKCDTLDDASLDAIPFAIEAARRLGRWDKLTELTECVKNKQLEPYTLFQVEVSRAMLGGRERSFSSVLSSLRTSRCAVMDGLSNAARESYIRAYDHVLQLQSLREIEDVSMWMCSKSNEATSLEAFTEEAGLCWSRRLGAVSSSGSNSVISARMSLARLAGDSVYEGSLFLCMGKKARKRGLYSAASNLFAQAETALRCVESLKKVNLSSMLRLQCAKLKHAIGESTIALRILGLDDIETMGSMDDNELREASLHRIFSTLGIQKNSMDDQSAVLEFVRSALQSTRWMIEGGLKGSVEVIARFRIIHRLAPNFEKGHFQFARYIDTLLQSRIMALQGRLSTQDVGTDDEKQRSQTISRDRSCMRFVGLIVKHFADSVILDVKHVDQALPRLLSLWFEFTGIKVESVTARHGGTLRREAEQLASLLLQSQDDVNSHMAISFKKISAQVLYTALPQLISRMTHTNGDTATVVQAMLRRVLTKYPAQAMWPLAWARQSRDPQRQRIGVEIFSQAIQALHRNESLKKLLVTSKILIDYLYALATKEVGDKIRDSMKVKPLSDEVDLTEFVPPIQAALSVSLISGDSSRSRDVFQRHIPRIRAFDDIVGVMNSKAKPKRLRAFVIAADSVSRFRTSAKASKELDVGEIHFLIKQEAKGDLRKDARVQDLNTVVNRIMTSTYEAKDLQVQRRRLHLKTFAVTCLSEDTGLLEWVPHTVALRSVISKTYNPQADSTHGKRQGKRITDFNDAQLRIRFEKKCQDAYFITGNLTKAAALFESECLQVYPPILYWWFVQQFPDPHAWYEARTRFALSAAAWSAVGHVIGLGDRHSENILLDKSTGECVHVDFDCIFDKGLHLPKPEVVPFRLTQNMVDAFGPTGADGVYSSSLKAAMRTLRENRDTLLSVLEPFVKDPVINWKRYRSQQQRGSNGSSNGRFEEDIAVEAKQKMSAIDERLRGIYNLRNPNYKKIMRTDRVESQQEEDDEFSHPIPLSVDGQVGKMIAEATSSENLVQLYVGWMPWV